MSPPRAPGLWKRDEPRHWLKAGEGWARWEPFVLHSLAAVDPVLLRALDARPGHRVLDVGCGLGEPTLSVASLVGPRGLVVGIDISPAMLATAGRRARARRARNVRLRRADALRFTWSAKPFDGVVSRYGIMFGPDPPALLAGVRGWLRRGGRAAFTVWGPPARNPSFLIRERVTRPFTGRRTEALESIPGGMRFSRSGYLARLLTEAGFDQVEQEGVAVSYLHDSPAAFARFTVETALSELAGKLRRDERARLAAGLAREAARYVDGGRVRMPGFAWVVSGRRR